MDARTRVRQFLATGTADRAPFLVMATRYTARLAQCGTTDLLADPGLFVRSYAESVAVLGLEAVLIEVPPSLAAGRTDVPEARAIMRENLHRLRATLRDQIAIVPLLPGPLTLASQRGLPATPDDLDDLVTGLIALQEDLGPAEFDALALLERAPVADQDIPALADAASAFWNVARYYSLPSLLIAARATPGAAGTGATAVAAWAGATAADLLAAGATAAGQPPSSPPAPQAAAGESLGSGPASLPPGGFYLTRDEIPPGQPVDAVRALIRRLSQR